MGSTELYFFEQHDTRKFSRRYRKLPEELPESLRFAHLNPKVAALLASKERAAKMDSEDPFGDGLGKKSLLPDINAAFTNVRNQFDSALCNDEDSQRYLFEEAKMSATNILHQLSQIIYRYEELHKHIPKSLEYHLMSGYNEFTADTVVVPREWQTQEMKEQYVAKLAHENAPSEDEVTSDNEMLTGRSKSRMGTDRSSSDLKTNLKRNKAMLGSIETINEIEVTRADLKPGRRSESRMSSTSMMRQHLGVETASRAGSRRKGSSAHSVKSFSGPSPSVIRGRRDNDLFSLIGETLDARSTTLGNPMNSFYQTINFQLSNPSFEEKGWIMLKGRQEEVDQNQILQYCVQRLQESLKDIAEQKAKEVDQGNDKPVFVRYYGDTKKETLLKYRKSPVKSSVNPISRGGKPKIPSISDERNEGRKLMQAQHNDGTTVVYYPSGRPAVIFTGAGFGRPGYYTIVYEDGLDSRMIACFTPSGRGVCHYANGVVRFLSTEKGGHIATEDGKIVQKWKWPQTNVKITEPINVQVNNHVMFRCVGLSQMSLVFSCQKEVARFTVGLTPEAELRGIEDGHKRIWDQLLTAFTFSSKAAKDLMRIFAPNKKSKKKARKHTSKSQSAEILKLLQDFPDKVTYEIEADKELAKLQRKARILVDDWMEHYRIAVGLVSPTLLSVRDTPTYSIHARNVKSARHSDHQLLIRRAVLGVADDQLSPRKKMRIPSAPLAGLGGEIDEDLASRLAAQHQPHDVYDDEPESGAGDEAISPSAMVIINRMTENASRRSAKSRASTAKSVSPSRQHTVITAADQDLAGATAPGRSHCPLVIRQQKLGYERPQCRCSRHYIPNMMDLELDDFVDTECPEGQLIVIMVVSSLKNIRGQQAGEVEYSFYFNKKGQPFRRVFPGITKAEEMVNEIYQNQNRNRTRPCVQSRSDMFRVFKYDINSAAEMSDHTQPFLLTRHNVVPGMFLIFCDGKLLFCDHIFNGYGNTRKDFKKQIMKSRHDAINGFSLPKDFRFSPSKGKSGMRSAWGGEIGGAGVDKYSSPGTVVDTTLQPIHRPNSNSTAESREIHLDAVKLQEACFISMSLSTTGFQPASRHLQSSRTHIPPV
ncbi:uncharacterized protein LOC127881598 isoform X6 [Dreissena polymorpha]|uniref:uncharacterized protein LOC127881598 isoform X6 n=1 Tax=Dreissena polymorpha TaxID=45954 RepID=UPI0022644120|nr:uncharacterized protein LOC127881598 isoform X6 [Dreissena polymorpha]